MELVLLLLTILSLMITGASCGGDCKVETCTHKYNEELVDQGLSDPVPTPEFCRILHNYGECVSNTARACRGNLRYHIVTAVMNPMKVRNNCTGAKSVVRVSPKYVPPTTTPSPLVPSCEFNGRRVFRHCGLFGDPHLKTFNNEYQTCRVQGAWPLIDNSYLAVQVTNEPVFNGSPATATTKVTVIIKGSFTPCTPERTYEATGDAPLPATFIDGTYSSKHISLLTSNESQPESIEIFIRYIETTIVIRRVGKYLAFSAKLPDDLIKASSTNEDNLQLCTKGCPPSERLDLAASNGHVISWDAAVEKCKMTNDLSNEISNNLTDYYIDWCVFDAMTAGDGHGFIAAAHLAQADALRMDPGSLKNRTTPLEFKLLPVSSSSATILNLTYSLTFIYLLATLNVVLNCS